MEGAAAPEAASLGRQGHIGAHHVHDIVPGDHQMTLELEAAVARLRQEEEEKRTPEQAGDQP